MLPLYMSQPTFTEISRIVRTVFQDEVESLEIYVKGDDLISNENSLLVVEMKKETSDYKFEFELPVITPDHDVDSFITDLQDIKQALFH